VKEGVRNKGRNVRRGGDSKQINKHAKSGTFHWQNRRGAQNSVFLLLGMFPPFEDHSMPRWQALVLEWDINMSKWAGLYYPPQDLI